MSQAPHICGELFVGKILINHRGAEGAEEERKRRRGEKE
jgi:hypothetical protein